MADPIVPMLVDPAWLQTQLDNPRVRILDCTTHMVAQPSGPSQIISGRSDFETGHIPGALHVDMVADLSDPQGDFPYTMLQPQQFQALANRLGLHRDDHVVLYADSSIPTLTRAWFVFHVMGHPRVSLLNGNKSYWKTSQGKLTEQLRIVTPSDYEMSPPRFDQQADICQVLAAIDK